MTSTTALALSVDDRRALWALTERHLRSETFAAVLLVRDAIRRGAAVVDVRTKGDALVVEDDGAACDDLVDEIDAVLAAPTVPALHRLEATRGTDLLVALATASSAEVRGRRVALTLDAGRPRQRAIVDDTGRNRITLLRPRRLRTQERDELRAWIPAPRASVRVDGTRLGAPSTLPADVCFARQVRTGSGHGQIGFMLDDTVSRFTVQSRGVWVSQEQFRPTHLPLVGVWDSDVVPPTWGPLLAASRNIFVRAGDDLLTRLALDYIRLGGRMRRRIRRALLRGATLPPAFAAVPLFDSARGPFTVSLLTLRERERVVVGDGVGDVFADDDGRAFLHRSLGAAVVDALPPPRRRLRLRFGL